MFLFLSTCSLTAGGLTPFPPAHFIYYIKPFLGLPIAIDLEGVFFYSPLKKTLDLYTKNVVYYRGLYIKIRSSIIPKVIL